MKDHVKIKIQQIWAALAGSASLIVGILKFVPRFHLKITFLDAAVHIFTGLLFIGGAWKYVSKQIFSWVSSIFFSALSATIYPILLLV